MTNFRSRSTYVRFSLESLNRTVANLVDGNKEIAKKIHRQLKEVCEEHVKVQLNKLENVNSSDNEHFLLLLDRIWQEHCKAFSLIINLFLKLDRHGYFSLNELGFKVKFFSDFLARNFKDRFQSESSESYSKIIHQKERLKMVGYGTLESKFLEG